MTTIGLIGAAGHGVWHRRTVAALPGADLVAVCDVRPVPPADGAPLAGVAVFGDHRAMLAEAKPEVVIVCTPPHTHLGIALDVLAAGADLLLEKPPVASLAEHDRLAAELAKTGRLCQVNFQALGSAALDRLPRAVSSIAVAGAWWRPPEYWRRSPWSGKGVDGALVNAFAHAVMQGLAVAEAAGFGPVAGVRVERYRVADIEVEDTARLVVSFAHGRTLTVAVTLATDEFVAGEVVVDGSAVLEYPTDRLRLPGADWVEVPGRVGMLANLLDHRADPAVPLLAPLARTREFTAILQAVLAGPAPVPVPEKYLVARDGGWAIRGAAEAVRSAALNPDKEFPCAS